MLTGKQCQKNLNKSDKDYTIEEAELIRNFLLEIIKIEIKIYELEETAPHSCSDEQGVE